MPQGVITNTINYDKFVGGEDSQALIESDVIVPDDMLDVINIISVDAKAITNNITFNDDKVQVDGEVRLNILYLNDKNKLVKLLKAVDFSHFLEVEGCSNKSRALVNVRTEHVEFNLINSRKIGVKIILNVSGRIFEPDKKDVVVGVQDSNEIEYLKKNVKFVNTIGQNSAETFLKEQVKIPDGAPQIDKIIKADILIKPDDPKINENRVVIQGTVHAYIVYETNNDSDFGYEECDLNYANFIEIPGALSYMNAKTYEDIIEQNLTIEPDENGENKVINVELVLKTTAVVLEEVETEIPIDIYGISKDVEPVIEKIESLGKAERFKSQAIFKEDIEFKNTVRKIIDVIGYPVLSDYSITDGKILLEGIIDYNILYLNDNGNIKTYKDASPFKTFVDASIENSELFVDLKISHISYDIIAMKESELKFVIDATVDAFDINNYDLLVDIKENENARSSIEKHSITIYMVQKDDDLWDIAKKYRTAKEDIINANELQDEKIKAGTKLIIPNKVCAD